MRWLLDSGTGDHDQHRNRDKNSIGHMENKAQSLLLEPALTFMDFQPRSLDLEKGGVGSL